jgi:magnesium/cobalt transport protein CorA
MTIKAYLYDATGRDREIELDGEVLANLHDQQLLWIDISEFEDREIRPLAHMLGLTTESVRSLLQKEHRPRLDHYGKYSQLIVNTIQEEDGRYRLVEVDFIFAANLVVTIHRHPVAFLQSFDRRVRSDSDLGELDAHSFLAGLLDWHILGYFRLVEELERAVDEIDAHALRPYHTRDLLSEMAKLRQRVAFVRRALTPHREVYAGLARLDVQTTSTSDSSISFAMLMERLDRAIDAVENARELLIGSFDIFTTQMTMRTNEAMKVLTLVSFVWFPASVIVGICALLVHTPVDPLRSYGFWIMLGCIALIGLITLIFARRRRWI